MAPARTAAFVYSHKFLLVDSPRATSDIVTEADAISQGIRPYLTRIDPSDMLNWKLRLHVGERIDRPHLVLGASTQHGDH